MDIVAEEAFAQATEAATALAHEVSASESKDRAEEDALLGVNSKPLLGVPISVKDQIDMAGFDSTCGLAARCFKPAKDDCILIKLLIDKGAIPFIRGNVPQCLMLPESDNNVWGQSKNPHDPRTTPGGSSGGDAALVAYRATPLAIGTDIGGSLRIPAHYCGIYTFKPTPQRISLKGISVPR